MRHDEPEVLGEDALGLPRLPARDDSPVNQQEARTGLADALDVHRRPILLLHAIGGLKRKRGALAGAPFGSCRLVD
jgi:hypothetical protein